MKQTAILFIFLTCCSAPKEKDVYPFKLINSKTETAGAYTDQMDIYVPVGDINKEMLVKLCGAQKETGKEGKFYYLVVFDRIESVTFPNSPFTALYGIEEEPQKHILALYEYNRLNGFSRLTFYSKNMWEGKPVTVEIE
jgi:hypothetical protein